MSYTSKRLYRSRNGKFFGVCQGIADWRDLPVEFVRLFVILAFVFTGFFPVGVIYFLAALILPLEPEGQHSGRSSRRDFQRGHGAHRKQRFHGSMYEDERSDERRESRQNIYEDVRDDFNDLKDRVRNMEDQVFDKEKDWDSRFKGNKDQ